jgi:hypothetical protein
LKNTWKLNTCAWEATFDGLVVSLSKPTMRTLTFLLAFCCIAQFTSASFADTSFISYNDFQKLSKREIKKQFGTDEQSKTIINNFYQAKHKGLGWLIPAVILNGGGTYFAILGANATNGMGGVVGLVLAITLFIPGLISLYLFLKRFVFGYKPSKERLYNSLKEHQQNR